MPFASSQNTAQAAGNRIEVSAPARVVLLDNRDSSVYNLVDWLAAFDSRIGVYRNDVLVFRVLVAPEPIEVECQVG